MGSGIVSSFGSACISGGGVGTFVVRVFVSRVYDGYVLVFNCRDVFSGRAGFSGREVNRHGRAEWGGLRSPPPPAYGLCGEFRVARASGLKIK